MANSQELEIIVQIFKETVRITSDGGNIGQAVAAISNWSEIGATDIDTYVFTHPNLTVPLYKAGQKNALGWLIKLNSSRYNPSFPGFNSTPKMVLTPDGKITWTHPSNLIPNRPDPAKLQAQLTETLKGLPKKLPMVIDPSKMTKEQLKFIRQLRFECIKKRFITSAGMSAGLSLVFNVGDLVKGNFTNYAVNVAKDTGIAAGTTLVGVALDGVPFLAEGANIIVMGAIDLTRAINSGDWTRFGLNLGLNTCATLGAAGGGKAGAALGTLICPGLGTAIGTGVGLIVGGGLGKYLGGKTPLGNMTEKEVAQHIKDTLNRQYKEIGIEVDPNLTLDQIVTQSKRGKLDLIKTADLTGAVSAEAVRSLIPEETLQSLLQIASQISPKDRAAGLTQICEILKKV